MLKNILFGSLIYQLCAVLDLINLYLIYDKFLVEKRRATAKTLWLRLVFMFVVSECFALLNISNIHNMAVYNAMSILHLLKAIPVLRAWFQGSKRDFFHVFLYSILVPVPPEGIGAVVDIATESLPYDWGVIDLRILLGTAGTTLLLLLLMHFDKKRVLKVYLGKLNPAQYISVCFAVFAAMFIQAGVAAACPGFLPLTVMAMLNIIAVYILIAQILFVWESDARKEKTIDIINEQMKNVTDYYNEMAERELETKKFRHDMKNLLLALHSLIEQKENKQALQYINKMNDICSRVEKSYDSGNFVADALLSTKATAGKHTHTALSFQGYIPSNIDNVDLVILLSNMLDNALEAAAAVDGEKRIVVESIQQKHLWLLSVSNPTVNTPDIRRNHIETTKDNRDAHGFGLQNMEQIVSKYNGTLSLECKDGVFMAKAMLQLNGEY